MKKFINRVEDALDESLRGFASAYSDLVVLRAGPTYVARRDAPVAGKVALVSGGGSGHEPLHAGFVGRGMLDAACPGQVFTSPTPDQMLGAAQAVDGGAGVLFIVKNFAGDVMNFEMAAEMFSGPHATVLVNDDVATDDQSLRRGVAGTLVVEKVVGAAAEAGAGLEACRTLGVRVNERTRSMGVALTSCTVPAVGRPTFDIGNDEMEMGVGIHGEKGRRRVQLAPADAVAEETGGSHRRGPEAPFRRPGAPAGERLRRNPPHGADPNVRRRSPGVGRQRGGGGAEPCGKLRDLPRHGRGLHHPLPPGRRYAPLLGCPCPNRGAALGALAGRPLVQAFTQ